MRRMEFGTHRKLTTKDIIALSEATKKRKRIPLEERLWGKVELHDDCWIWTGAKTKSGYGNIGTSYKPHSNLCAHRAGYELLLEEVDPSLDLDHLCRNAACCNPFHLEPVPHCINVSRGKNGTIFRTGRCRKGHIMVGDNIRRVVVNGKPKNRCRTCDQIATRRWQSTHKPWRKKV